MIKRFFLLLLIPSLADAADLNQITLIPDSFIEYEGGGGHSYTSTTIDSTNDRWGYIFQAPAADTITQCCYSQSARTGTPGNLQVGIKAVGTDGYPTGAYLQSNTAAPSGTDLTVCRTFTGVPLTLGTFYACEITPSGTWDAGNSIGVRYYISNTDAKGNDYAYRVVDGGAAARDSRVPIGWVKSATKSYGSPIITNCANDGTCNTASGTTEVGMRFSLPTGACSTAKLLGIKFLGGIAAGGTLTMRLYSGGAAGDTTSLTSIAVDTDMFASSTTMVRSVFFSSLQTLTCGSTYRISLMPTTQTLGLQDITVPTNADLTAVGGGQENSYYTTRNGGNWTDTNTRSPMIGLILDDITTGAGGGGIKNLNTTSGGAQ